MKVVQQSSVEDLTVVPVSPQIWGEVRQAAFIGGQKSPGRLGFEDGSGKQVPM